MRKTNETEKEKEKETNEEKKSAYAFERESLWEKDLVCEQGPCLPPPCVSCLACPLWLFSFSPYPMIYDSKTKRER